MKQRLRGQKLMWKQCVHFLFSVSGGGDGSVFQGYRGGGGGVRKPVRPSSSRPKSAQDQYAGASRALCGEILRRICFEGW